MATYVCYLRECVTSNLRCSSFHVLTQVPALFSKLYYLKYTHIISFAPLTE
jgi:hypothetical protein